MPAPRASPATTPSSAPMLMSTRMVSRTATAPPARPASDRARKRTREPFCSRCSTRAVNREASGMAGVRANRRSTKGSNSSADMLRSPQGLCGFRLEPRAEFIQTTFDMRLHRAEWQIQGGGDLGMRHARSVTEGDAQPLYFAERPERVVEVDQPCMIRRGRRLFGRAFGGVSGLVGDPLDVE